MAVNRSTLEIGEYFSRL